MTAARPTVPLRRFSQRSGPPTVREPGRISGQAPRPRSEDRALARASSGEGSPPSCDIHQGLKALKLLVRLFDSHLLADPAWVRLDEALREAVRPIAPQ